MTKPKGSKGKPLTNDELADAQDALDTHQTELLLDDADLLQRLIDQAREANTLRASRKANNKGGKP